MKDTKSLSHTSYRCKYHVVIVPKYRRMVIYNKLRKDVGQILRMLCERKPELLQDVHWSGGMFGYFPSYAIGSAIASQNMAAMKKEMDVDQLLLQGELKTIGAFLNIYTTDELLNMMMGESFNPQYYVDYLKDKYTKLYHLN